ncbi:peptidase domain-containing ABC transporter [Flagellimonas onchidii]|uniref:peptidase domain-containing ABC transporter n=1 Tax=Flagellimonas onchidii TaxID=2562684 RepID=UPI0010A67F50|nr:peptidase domain-containing ABC transporter [Allomuricauda onchidii]
MSSRFPHFLQRDNKDCGPICLKVIAKHYGKNISLEYLRTISETTRSGSNLKFLGAASEKIGFKSLAVKITIEELKQAPLPCILHWNQNHFVILYKIRKNKFFISDPATRNEVIEQKEFLIRWIGNSKNANSQGGICLLLEPTSKLDKNEYDTENEISTWGFVYPYLKRQKKVIVQLIIGLLGASLIQLAFPFLTQNLVDVGIKNQDIHFVYLVLIAQVFLFIGRTIIEVIRGWLLLHVASRLNISLLSEFLIKLMNLPLAYYDKKQSGDILRRIKDHQRIEILLKNSSLNALFSSVTFIVFGIVLALYSLKIFSVFLIGTVLYFAYLLSFLSKRRRLDDTMFREETSEHNKLLEIIEGMQETKLNNSEIYKRRGWEFIQSRIFNLKTKSLSLTQYQLVGSDFINELKNIVITILAAKLVIDGEITLGMMLAISFIVGQLNSPVSQLIEFILNLQDAKISISRILEIHNMQGEYSINETRISEVPVKSDLLLEKVSFRYFGTDKLVLNDLSITIKKGEVTAVVGKSGSGKTTLLKLFLQYYEPIKGTIKVGNTNLNMIAQDKWRSLCGIVMQDGFIFDDTITRNIALGEEEIDSNKLEYAIEVAHIKEFIEGLPLNVNTKIGGNGLGISMGQKQRILIARAIYKDPSFLFLDEATSSLDANSEKEIIKNLEKFYQNRTVVIIAHRLSTVQNADNIIVMDEGKICEQGTHRELIATKGEYFKLVKNQLEL